MSVGLDHPQELLKINGIRLSVGSAGIYSKKRNDIALMEISLDSVVSAAFTKNHFCAALFTILLCSSGLAATIDSCSGFS